MMPEELVGSLLETAVTGLDAERDDWKDLVGGAQSFGRILALVQRRNVGLSLDAAKDVVWALIEYGVTPRVASALGIGR